MARKAPSPHSAPKPEAGTQADAAVPVNAPAPAQADAPEKGKSGKDETEGPAVIVTGPKGGRRRAGFAFGPEAVTLTRDELPQTGAGIDAFLAILSDPKLSCRLVNADGAEVLVTDEVIAALKAERDAIVEQLGA